VGKGGLLSSFKGEDSFPFERQEGWEKKTIKRKGERDFFFEVCRKRGFGRPREGKRELLSNRRGEGGEKSLANSGLASS